MRLTLRRAPLALAATVPLVALAVVAHPGPAAALSGTPAFTNLVAPSSLFNAEYAGEPSLGVNGKTGALMYQASTSTYKVVVDAAGNATWTDVTPLASLINIDPILSTDRTTGRTFAGGLDGECSLLSYTDNDGASWTPMTNACAIAFDHQSIGSGPWAASGKVTSLYNRAVYYCAQTSYDMCATSRDGGLTFGPGVPVLGACAGLHGHVKVSADGTAYLPNANCGGKAGGGISTNSGLTWSSYVIPGSSQPATGFDPSVGTTPDNTLYEAWQGADNHTYVAKSTNHGSSWSTPVDVGASLGVVNSTFQSVIAGDNGRVAVAYLGSTTPGNPFAQSWNGVWDLYVSTTYDGGATWTTVKATTDPVQRGWMCADGTTCGSGRNLLDFMDVNMTKDGRVVVGYADGCIGACALPSGTKAQSTASYATIAYQATGKGLLAAYDTP